MAKKEYLPDLRQYKKIFETLDENQRVFAEKIYKEADFMNKTLKKLKKSISTEGAIVERTNGNGFETITENPAQKSYNTMIRNYTAVLKTLAELAPPASKGASKLERLFGADE